MYKQVIVVRTDLKMGKGKIASQVAHASLCAFLKSDENIREKWLKEGSEKIVLKVGSEEELLHLYDLCIQNHIPSCLVKDAAKTQLKEPAFTALGIGPDKEEKINKITKDLKLL